MQNQATIKLGGSLSQLYLKTGKHRQFLRCLIAGGLNTGGAQILRLGGNLALTRLLVPEAFGLMALVSVFLVGLEMFSDVGIGASIVHRKEEPTSEFLQTAWTLQVMRGIFLWLVASIAAFPLAAFYGNPQLAAVLPVAAFTLVLAGFKSTAIHLCSRKLKHGALTAADLSTALLGLVVSISIAAYSPTVWALVIGGLAAVGSNMAVSWLFLPEQTAHQFRWDRKSADELIKYGKWIFVGTVFAFLGMNGDRLLLGKFLSLSELGIYTVAFFFAHAITQFMAGIATRVLFPVFSRSSKASDKRKYRGALLTASLVPICIFLIAGPQIINFLYDDRYLSAGSMLQILSLASGAAIIRAFSEPVLLANGDSFSRMKLAGAEALLVLSALCIGGSIAGLNGFIWGYVVGQFVTLIPTAILLHRHQSWFWKDDFLYLGTIGVVAWFSLIA